MDGIDLATLPARICEIPRRWAQQAPDAPALTEGGRSWTYAQLAESVDIHVRLLRELGVRAGDRVMVVGENCAAQVALVFAAAAVDAWIVNVNARLSAREIATIREHSGARRVLYTVGCSQEAAAHAAREGATLHGELMIGPLNAGSVPEPVQADGGQVAALIYTTGTTGQPKGVMLTHRNVLYIAAVSSGLRGLTPSDRAYGVLPISHVYGLASVMLGTLYAGACLCLAPRFSAEALLRAVRDEGLTILQGVPAMYARLLEMAGGDRVGTIDPYPPYENIDPSVTGSGANSDPSVTGTVGTGSSYPRGTNACLPSHLRFIYAGGSPLDPSLKQQVEHLLGLPLHNGYGMTESSPTISQTRLDAPRSDTSVGFAIPGVELRIVDTGGIDVPPGASGELWVRGPNVMKGYYREPELTAATMRPGGWLNTGDMARQDADGALFIVGRTKELIIRSGFNVYPLEIETVLNAHPGVTQSAVVGRSVEGGNEEVVAFVEADPHHPAGVAELHAWLAERLSPYKCPAQIVIMPALPAAATGKILKGQLQALAQTMSGTKT